LERLAKPKWLKVPLPNSPRYHAMKVRAKTLKLATVCEEARCPNIGECWSAGTATFMVMGDTCTRGCRFCAVKTGKNPGALDADEPENLATAVEQMALEYIVVTSVDRDDLADAGAGHFADCITAVRARCPDTRIEVLTPDFDGGVQHLAQVIDSKPDVFGHNIETVERLTPRVRDPRSGYRKSLSVLKMAKTLNPDQLTKSSIMVGVGETPDEVLVAMADLRENGVDFLTIGQYLRPSSRHLAISEYIQPAQFEKYKERGLEMGFKFVASGPLVRSSYRAGEYFIHEYLEKHRPASESGVVL
jgi:lipoic acid synthetase